MASLEARPPESVPSAPVSDRKQGAKNLRMNRKAKAQRI